MEKFFYNSLFGKIEIEVSESVYPPQEDSMLMAKVIESMIHTIREKKALDMGCGSGFISTLLSKAGACVVSVDINSKAVENSRKNAELNRIHINVLQSDLFSNVRGRFDFIFFNAPYLPSKDENIDEMTRIQWSMVQRDENAIERFARESVKHLSENGKVIILFSSLSGDVQEIFRDTGFETRILEKQKLEWEEIFVMEAEIKMKKIK